MAQLSDAICTLKCTNNLLHMTESHQTLSKLLVNVEIVDATNLQMCVVFLYILYI